MKLTTKIFTGSSALALAIGIGGGTAHAQAAHSDKQQSTNAPVTANVDVTYKQLQDADKDSNNWMLYGRTYDNQRNSPLKQIDTKNVGSMVPVATIQTGVAASFEVSPIVVNGIMFISTPYNHVMAYDATTGKNLWSYTAKLSYTQLCCGPESRGVAVADGKVFLATLDAHLIALDAHTGKELWNTAVDDSRAAFSITMAPQIYDGKLLVGMSGAEFPTRDYVAAYDAKSGKQIWKFYTIPAPDEPGGKTWAGDSWKSGGGSMWNTPAIDPERGLAIFAVGNPNPDEDGASRMGDNAYTDSIVAVHMDTGKIAWWNQQVPHDVWDLDAMAPVILLNVKDADGKMVPAAAEAGKEGQVFIVNRDTGKLIRKSDSFVKQSSTVGTPLTPDKYVNIYPGAQGGNEWSPEAYSPETGLFYVQGTNESWEYKAASDDTVVGHLRLGGVLQPITPEGVMELGEPDVGKTPHETENAIEPSGTLSAVDVNTGKIKWQYQSGWPMLGGVTTTAGNLVFAGEFDGNFDAFNATTGEKLWHYQMGAGVNASPVTYMVNGRQYVAVAAGGNAANGNNILMKKLGLGFGDTIMIFGVNKPATATN